MHSIYNRCKRQQKLSCRDKDLSQTKWAQPTFFNWISIIVIITEMRAKSVFSVMNDITTYMYEDLLDLNVAIARLKFALQTLFRSHA